MHLSVPLNWSSRRPAVRAVRTALSLLPAFGVLVCFALMLRWPFTGLPLRVAALTALGTGLGVAWTRRFLRRREASAPVLSEELDAGATALMLGFLLVHLFGDALMPIVYLMLAFFVVHMSKSAGLILLGIATCISAAQTLPMKPDVFLLRLVFSISFSILYHVVLSARLAAAHHAEANAVKNKIRDLEERARTFRLVSSGTQNSLPGANDQEKWLVAAVKEIEGATGSALEVVELALGSHTVAAFLLTQDDRNLRLHDCRSLSECVERERFSAQEGIFGALIKRGLPIRMHSEGGIKGVTHYQSGGPLPKSLLAVPLLEGGGLVRGVLVADRLDARPFTETDEQMLATTATEVWRAIEVERVMGYIRRSRDEKDQFFRAIEELNRAGKPEQVFQAVLDTARRIGQLDFCAVTLVSEVGQKREHRIVRMSGVTSAGRALEGQTFADNNGLVSNVVRYGAPLPGREVNAMERQIIFDDHTQVRGLLSLKIFPLVASNRIVGTLVAGSRKKAAFERDELRMLEVIAIQAAQAVLRAQLFEQMETMATTDGLTGLLNHRTFQSKFDEQLNAAKRYGRKLSVILTDVDHFKSVNDTYGHPTGDVVLKGVARIVREQARDADIVARYGGEEFAIVMPETDAKGAHVIAERIRERIGAEVFQTEQGPLKVTLSLGIATFPDSSTDRQALIDLADQCLYFAKRHGRNQSVTVAAMQTNGRREAAG
jgi:two-component system, cell cycle response regulator